MSDAADFERRPGRPRPQRETIAGREPPNNVELERAILAVLLDGRHATAMHKVRAIIEHPLGFFLRDHRIVYLACLELDDAGHRVDAQSAAELLSRYDFKALLENELHTLTSRLEAGDTTAVNELATAPSGATSFHQCVITSCPDDDEFTLLSLEALSLSTDKKGKVEAKNRTVLRHLFVTAAMRKAIEAKAAAPTLTATETPLV